MNDENTEQPGDNTNGEASPSGDNDSNRSCDRDAAILAIMDKIATSQLEAEVADLEKLLVAIEKAEESYGDKLQELTAKDLELKEFLANALVHIRSKDGGNLSDDDIKRIEAISKAAVDEVTKLEGKVADLKGVMPAKPGDEGTFAFGSVATARMALETAQKDHDAAAAKLKELCDLAGALGAKHTKLGTMRGDIEKRIGEPRAKGTFGTAWWLLKQGDTGGVLSAKSFFEGCLKGEPSLINPDCLAEDISAAWNAEASAKAEVYRSAAKLKDEEDKLKNAEKALADAKTGLFKDIITKLEVWDSCRQNFPMTKEPAHA